MIDEFAEVRETGFGQNIISSIKGVVVGLILFLASFVVLWLNEGRVDMSKVAQASIPVNADTVDHAANGSFVSVTGKMETEETLGDPQFLKAGPYIALSRKAEMYAWVEHKSTKSRKKVGGGKTSETTYSYKKEWTDHPDDSSSFKHQEGHGNLSPSVRNQTFRVREATLGAYSIDPQSMKMPRSSPVSITKASFVPSEKARLEGGHIFIGNGTMQSPVVGDVRISYSAVKPDTAATLFGTLTADKIGPYYYKGKKEFYRAIEGPRETAIAKLASEHRIITWVLRGVGFLMMWIGLSLFFGPINAVLDFIPMLGGLGRSVIGLAMFVVAMALSLLTMLVSLLAHNVLLLIAAVVSVVAVIWMVGRMSSKQKPAPAYVAAGDASAPPQASPEERDPTDEEEAMHMAVQKPEMDSDKIRFKCDECGKGYTVNASLAGEKARCKKCGSRIYIPEESM